MFNSEQVKPSLNITKNLRLRQKFLANLEIKSDILSLEESSAVKRIKSNSEFLKSDSILSRIATLTSVKTTLKNHTNNNNNLANNNSESSLKLSNSVIVQDSSNGYLDLWELTTQTPTQTSVETVSTSLDLSQTFFLNSLPGANQTIYLDFDGNITSGTFWNTMYHGGNNITTPSFDLDGDSSSFSSEELERIQYLWQRVAEAFIPFNVNVTTQAPKDINDLIKSDNNDTRWGTRVCIGGSYSDWYGSQAGGVSYVGSFNWDNDTPNFIFAKDTNNGNEHETAYVIIHEVGHALGLQHDGRINPLEEYYSGHGSGATGWAPIMGVGYYKELLQWSKGEYASANNTEDDLEIITTQNGFGYRPDDCGNTIATAKPLTTADVYMSGSGIIERNTDIDFYSFVTGAGVISLSINPASRGPSLDILAALYDSTGKLIASSNPIDLLSANILTTVFSGGTYYLKIDGVGKGDPLTTGYTDYGSLGQYFISGSRNLFDVKRWVTNQGGFWNTQQWLSGDFNGDGKDDLGKAFDGGGLASIDTHLSDGASFSIGRWVTRQGAFADTQKWLSGDFNGDRKDDLVKVFNDGGLASIDTHLSDGTSFSIGRWATGQGGFWDTQKWLVGDFNSDGKDDLVNVFNDGGLASINTHLSDGASFSIGRWATGQGIFADTQKWLSGDFNGDGKDDLVKVFNDGGLANIDTHLSDSTSFSIGRWATGQGGFADTQKWLVGDFNGDGKDDLVNVFNDGGLASIDTHLSTGVGFTVQRWATGQCSFADTDKWLVGDFNGDGKDDLAKVFNEGGLATIDTHILI